LISRGAFPLASMAVRRRGNASRRLADRVPADGQLARSSPLGTSPMSLNRRPGATLQGDYFLSLFRPWSLPNAGTAQMQAAKREYAHFTKTYFPSFGQEEAWAGADLMIKGLELAGPSPTRAAVIKDLRRVKSYNDNGMLPFTINYSTDFGHDLPQTCSWMMQAKGSGFVAVSSKPFCGTDIPGTSTASASS
jgi:substrate-binding family protein